MNRYDSHTDWKEKAKNLEEIGTAEVIGYNCPKGRAYSKKHLNQEYLEQVKSNDLPEAVLRKVDKSFDSAEPILCPECRERMSPIFLCPRCEKGLVKPEQDLKNYRFQDLGKVPCTKCNQDIKPRELVQKRFAQQEVVASDIRRVIRDAEEISAEEAAEKAGYHEEIIRDVQNKILRPDDITISTRSTFSVVDKDDE